MGTVLGVLLTTMIGYVPVSYTHLLCIQHQVVLHGFCQRRIVCFCIRVQTVCKLPTVVGILVVLDRIGVLPTPLAHQSVQSPR